MMAAEVRRTALTLILMTAVISGVSNFVNFWAVRGTNSDAFVAARNLAAGAALAAGFFVVAQPKPWTLRPKDWARLAIVGLIGGAIPFALFFRGLAITGSSATASFVYRALFLVALVPAVVVFRERPSKRLVVGGFAMLAGNALLLSLVAPGWDLGATLVLLATILWTAEYSLSKWLLRDLPSGAVGAARMGFGGLFLLAWVAISGQLGAMTTLTPPQWQWAIVSTVLVVGFVATWYAGLAHVELSKATALLTIAFPITFALAVVFGAQPWTARQAAGAAIVVFGVLLAVGFRTIRDSIREAILTAAGAARRA